MGLHMHANMHNGIEFVFPIQLPIRVGDFFIFPGLLTVHEHGKSKLYIEIVQETWGNFSLYFKSLAEKCTHFDTILSLRETRKMTQAHLKQPSSATAISKHRILIYAVIFIICHKHLANFHLELPKITLTDSACKISFHHHEYQHFTNSCNQNTSTSVCHHTQDCLKW